MERKKKPRANTISAMVAAAGGDPKDHYVDENSWLEVIDYAKKVEKSLYDAGIRVYLNSQAEKMGAKIRQAELQRINVMLVVGEKEAENDEVSVRRRFQGDLGAQSLSDTVKDLQNEIITRRNTYRTN